MRKVLFLINSLAGGGAERVLINLANELSKRSYKITVRTLADVGENKKFLSKNVKYEYIYKKKFRGLNYLYLLPHKYIYQKVAYGDFDVIIVYLHGVLTRIVSYAPSEQKTIAYLHANMEKSPFMKRLGSKEKIRDCFKNYNRIVAVSEEVKDSFIRASGIHENVCVKYNTFSVQEIQNKSKEDVDNQKFVQGDITLCSVGKLERVKGYLRLLKVIKRITDEGIKVCFNLIGEGSERKELEKYISDNNLQNNVSLVGFDINPYKYIKASDLFVCSSYSEGFSSVVAESLILRVPVLTTDCAGMKELLGSSGEYGLIVDNDEEGLYEGLIQLVRDQQLLEYYRRKAYERARFFEPEKSVGEVEKMIKEVVECQN